MRSLGKHARHHSARRLSPQGSRLFERRQVNASPLGQGPLARRHFARAARRGIAREGGSMGLVESYKGYKVT